MIDNFKHVKKIIAMYEKELSLDEKSKRVREHLNINHNIAPYDWADLTPTRSTKLKRYRLMIHELLIEIERGCK